MRTLLAAAVAMRLPELPLVGKQEPRELAAPGRKPVAAMLPLVAELARAQMVLVGMALAATVAMPLATQLAARRSAAMSPRATELEESRRAATLRMPVLPAAESLLEAMSLSISQVGRQRQAMSSGALPPPATLLRAICCRCWSNRKS